MARIVEHLPIEELEERYRAAEAVTEARHHQAIWPLAQGRTFLEAAEVLAFVPRRATRLARRHDAFGPSALGDRRRRNGRAAGLPTEDVPAALAERVEAPPEDGGVLERPQGRPPDGAAARPGEGAPAARPGGAGADRLVDPGARRGRGMRARPRPSSGRPSGGARGGGRARARAAHPDRPVEVWAADEHRLGLEPIRRRVRAPVGRRPVALGHHRHRRPHVVAFVQPTGGEAVRFLSTGLPKPFFEALLAAFARETGAGRERHIVLVPDDAGWHGPEGLAVPEGIGLVFLPPYSPEPQPAEHLWPLVDEPAAAGRAPLAAGRRADRRSALRHARRPRGRRRRTLPTARGRRHQATYRFPLVAQAHHSELIIRIWYERLLSNFRACRRGLAWSGALAMSAG